MAKYQYNRYRIDIETRIEPRPDMPGPIGATAQATLQSAGHPTYPSAYTWNYYDDIKWDDVNKGWVGVGSRKYALAKDRDGDTTAANTEARKLIGKFSWPWFGSDPRPEVNRVEAVNNVYTSGTAPYMSFSPRRWTTEEIIVEKRGSYVDSVVAENGTYPNDGKQGDYWYVRQGLVNATPTIKLDTTNARTLYEGDTIGLTGNVSDTDAGNVMTVKYNVNGGTSRAIYTAISSGSPAPFSRVLTFRNGRLYDGNTAVTSDLQEGAQNTIRVWAEDDQGGRSADILRTFQVVPNRPAVITLNPIAQTSGLIDTDKVTVSGNVSDPDGNSVKVEYKIGSGSFAEIINGAGGAFSFDIALTSLSAGDNTITIRATDTYGATANKTLKITKSGAVAPLKKSQIVYEIKPPNGTAQGVLLWIERDSGDLAVTAEISMTAEGEAENWQPMTLSSTAYVDDSVEEDEYTFEHTAPVEKVKLRLTLERQNVNSTAGVRLISGVLS